MIDIEAVKQALIKGTNEEGALRGTSVLFGTLLDGVNAIRELEAQLAEARKDSERYEFMAIMGFGLATSDSTLYRVWATESNGIQTRLVKISEGSTPREAINNAMAAEAGKDGVT